MRARWMRCGAIRRIGGWTARAFRWRRRANWAFCRPRLRRCDAKAAAGCPAAAFCRIACRTLFGGRLFDGKRNEARIACTAHQQQERLAPGIARLCHPIFEILQPGDGLLTRFGDHVAFAQAFAIRLGRGIDGGHGQARAAVGQAKLFGKFGRDGGQRQAEQFKVLRIGRGIGCGGGFFGGLGIFAAAKGDGEGGRLTVPQDDDRNGGPDRAVSHLPGQIAR